MDQNNMISALDFEKALSKIGVFLTTQVKLQTISQELRALYNVLDPSRQGKLSLQDFLNSLKVIKLS